MTIDYQLQSKLFLKFYYRIFANILRKMYPKCDFTVRTLNTALLTMAMINIHSFT